ncbi:hypothetical protein [Clostridium cellulovorans]|uniref:Uncharacterized protein n=1 Tax=Clostridium cellulovorans (strain ATCC 35296 / DSM 3052 / OCM 3 / 743B) TaxID=573061 RepID=D9SVD9_CLOC7|nr:hypothetical protein [Clostridium cellulovorans]ADL51063.1 hypothetical protein Clocel_1309 [Clostridium cellulovorans 743B]
METKEENQEKFYISTTRIIYALAVLSIAYILFVDTVLNQKAWFMIIIIVLLLLLLLLLGFAISFIERAIGIYINDPYENDSSRDKKGDFIGFVLVLMLLLEACGINTI